MTIMLSYNYDEKRHDSIFIMKDIVSAEDVIANGVEKAV
jgi:hypothetical protein